MITHPWFRVALVTLIALLAGLFCTQAQRRGNMEEQVTTGTPPGLLKKIEPEYPAGFVTHGVQGRGLFRLTINPRSGDVDEVKIVKSTGYIDLNKLAAKALLQWKFKPGSVSPVEVPVEFYVHGGSRILH